MNYVLDAAGSLIKNKLTPILKGVLVKYFSNFDADKFQIDLSSSVGVAIVDLKDLILHTDVLNQFDLPFTVAYGRVGKVRVEILLKSLVFGSPSVSIILSDVYILASPPSTLPYDENREREKFLDTKRKNLEAAEVKRAAAGKQKEKGWFGGSSDDEPADEGLPSIVIGIINNCKISVQNIHIRYEDAQTPFSFGIVLKDINAVSTDSNYQPAETGSDEKTFFKKAELQGLGLYWNTETRLILSKDKSMDDAISEMKQLVADQNNNELKYILGPIVTTVKAMVTLSPSKLDTPFSKPMLDIDIGMDTLFVGITNLQFREILQFGDNIESMQRAKKYLKFRPYDLPYKGNAKKWWKFAYACVLDRVQKRSWKSLSERQAKIGHLCDQYKIVYDKILNKQDEEASRAEAAKLEDEIPNYDILMIRSREELYLKKKDEAAAKKLSQKSWWQSADAFKLTPAEIQAVLSAKFSPEETKKILDQVGQVQEVQKKEPVKYPDDFVDKKIEFKLPQLVLDINNAENKALENVLNLKASSFDFGFRSRPANSGMLVDLSMDNVNITGWKQHDIYPSMVKAIKPTDTSKFLNLNFEKNPLNSTASKKIKLETTQLEVIFDSKSIQKLIDCFTWPTGVELITVQNAASDAMESIKSGAKDGVKAIADNTEEMDVDIQIHAPYILIPQDGDYFDADCILILNFGDLIVRSIPPQRDQPPDPDAAASLLGDVGEGDTDFNFRILGSTEDHDTQGDVNTAVLKLMYNQYTVQLVNVEILVALAGEDIDAAIKHSYKDDAPDEYHFDRPAALLKTGDIIVDLNQCLVSSDVRYAKMKADIVIPVLDFQITDHRLLKLVKLVVTLPIPTRPPPALSAFIGGVEDEAFQHDTELDDIAYTDVNLIMMKFDLDEEKDNDEEIETQAVKLSSPTVFDPEKASQLTDLILDLHLQKIKTIILRYDDEGKSASVTPILNSDLYNMNIRFKSRGFGTTIDGSIGGMISAYYNAREPGMADSEETLYLLHTPLPENANSKPLIRFHMFLLREDCPKQPEGAVRKKFDVEVYSMDIVLHQESLHVIFELLDSTFKEIQVASKPKEVKEKPAKSKDDKVSKQFQKKEIKDEQEPNPKDVNLNVTGLLNSFSVKLTSEACRIGKITIEELIAQFQDKPLQKTIFAQLEGIEVLNMDLDTVYPKVLICSSSEKLIIAEIQIFNDKTRAENLPDISVDLHIMAPKVILLGSFIGNLLKFVKQLAADSAALTTASSKAGEKVVKAAKQVYAETSSKMALNIKVDAPTIILPKSELSTDGVLLDLGLLTIQNSLSLQDSDIKGQNAVMDSIELHLEGVKVSRTIVNLAAQSTLAEIYLVEPITIDALVKRNLSSSWYHGEPVLSVTAGLNPAVINASDTDVALLLACVRDLTENLSAGESTVSPVQYEATAADSALIGAAEDDTKPEPKAEPDDVPVIVVVAADLALNLKLEEVALRLYLVSPTLEGQPAQAIPRDPKDSLANVSINAVGCKLAKWNNNDLEVNLTLKKVLLQDTRADTGRTKDFIQQGSAADPNSDTNMLSIGFSQKIQEQLNMFYDVKFHTDSLQILLDIGYLKALADFASRITRTIPKTKKKTKPVVPAIEDRKLLGAEDAGRSDIEEIPEKPVPPAKVNASIQIKDVDILVLEDVNDNDTNALQVKVSGGFTMIQKDSGNHGDGEFNLTANTAKYNPSKVNELLTKIVDFENISFVADIDDETGTIVSIKLPDTFVRVSAGTLLLITKIVGRFSGKKGDGADTDEEEVTDYTGAWDPISNRNARYWFLDPAIFIKKEALVQKAPSGPVATKDSKESLTLETGKILISLEVGVGSMTTPLIAVETKLAAEVQNWSRDNLSVKGGVEVSALYNNTYVGMWEYILEPITVDDPRNFGPPETQPWKLEFNVGHRALPAGSTAKPPRSIDLTATKVLELTLSRTAFSAIQALVDNFTVSTSSKAKAKEDSVNTPPYLLLNDSGSNITFNIDNTDLTCIKGYEKLTGDIALDNGQEIDLGVLLSSSPGQRSRRYLTVSIPDYKFKKVISVNHAQPRFYPVSPAGNTNTKFGILVDMVTTPSLSTLITLRSTVQVTNELELPVNVSSQSGTNVKSIGSMEPGKTLNLPLLNVYSKTDGLIFEVQGYKATSKPYNWITSGSKTASSVTAKPSAADGLEANIKIFSKIYESVLEDTDKTTPLGANYTLKLQAPVLVNNYLPTPLTISIEGKSVGTIGSGEGTNILGVDPSKRNSALDLKLTNFQGQDWTFKMYFSSMDAKSLNPIKFTGADNKTLYFGCRKKVVNEINQISIYYPYWLVNQTGLRLTYKGDREKELTHVASDPNPKMFAYTSSGKNKALFKVEDSDWSDKMNLEAAMSSAFTCKSKTRDYQVTVSIALSESAMTKIVTFLPKYTISNTCSYSIVVEEKGSALTVPPKTTVPFWPTSKTEKDAKISFKVLGTSEQSSSIFMARTGTNILRFDNKYGGVCANVHAMENKTTLTLSEFMPGDTPVLLVNDTTDLQIEFQQKTGKTKRTVDAGKSEIYTWEDFTTENGQNLIWSPVGLKVKGFPTLIDTAKPANGTFISSSKGYYWISFQHGLRIIFIVSEKADLVQGITDYLKIGTTASFKTDGTSEPDSADNVPKLDLAVLLDGIGISLVDNVKAREVLYVRIGSTDVIWEETEPKGKKYKTITDNRFLTLELGYTEYITGKLTQRPATLTGGVQIDYADFMQTKPSKMQLRRRAYQPGLRVGYKSYEDSTGINLSVSQLQIDNQLPHTDYPRTFMIAPIPKSVTNISEVHPPLLIVNFKQRTQPKSTVKIISATAILQEFKVAADMALINQICAILPGGSNEAVAKVATEYNNDLKVASKTDKEYLEEEQERVKEDIQQTLFEKIEIYMLKLSVTFCMNGDEDDSYFKSVLMGLGSMVVSVTDKPIKVDGLKIQNKSMTQKQLMDSIIEHYKSGIISNFYTVVLQLDVLGNPYKLITGLTTGLGALVEEPFQGAMNGNLIEGVSNGVGAVLDGTVFGLTDTLGTIAKSLGKGVDALGIPILGYLVGGFGQGLLNLGYLTGNKDTVPPPVRLPRPIKPKAHLEPYSDYSGVGSRLYDATLAAHPSAGPYLMHFIFTGSPVQALVLSKDMAIYVKVDASCNVSHVNWAHKWTEFVSITQIAKTNEVVYNLPPAEGGIFGIGTLIGGDKTLEVKTNGPEMLKWVHDKSEVIRKAAVAASKSK